MPTWHEIVTVHTEGDTGDVLFTLPPGSREYHEGNKIRYVTTAGVSTTYNVESVDSVVREEIVNPNPNNPSTQHAQPEVFYGVSIVP